MFFLSRPKIRIISRRFGTSLLIGLILLGTIQASKRISEAGLRERFLVDQGEDLRIESFGARRIVRLGDVSYIGYSKLADGRWHIVVCPFDHRTQTFGTAVDIAPGTDDHSIMGLVADSKGRLHCISGGHGPLSYTRTVQPGDISEWTRPEKISEEGTYSMPLIGRDDRIYVFYRHKWVNLAMQTRSPAGEWSPLKTIGTATGDKGFYIMGATIGNEPGRQSLHIVGHFYGEPETFGKSWPKESYGYRIKPWYIRSLDGGETWQKADGTRLSLPVSDETIDILFDFADPYDIPWSVDIALDEANRPHITCAWSRRSPAPGVDLREVQAEIGRLTSELWELTCETGGWQRKRIGVPSLENTHISHPAAVYADGCLHVVAAISPLSEGRRRGEDPVGRLCHLWRLKKGPWREEMLDSATGYANLKLPDGSGVLEAVWRGRPPGGNQRNALFYCTGLSGSPKPPAKPNGDRTVH
jgi:hypothetical protein